MVIHSKTDIGRVRSTNQDAFFAGELEGKAVFAVVCDGMGGANAGNIASEGAVKIISEYILSSYNHRLDEQGIMKLLKNSIVSANLDLYEMAKNNCELEGMGTTVVAALVRDNMAVIAHVGDSRAYLVAQDITQLTKDHSIVQSLVETGKISPEDALRHPEKNIITRALGTEDSIVADCESVELAAGDTLLLCTDGLSNFVDTKDMQSIIKQDISLAAEKLVKLANKNGGNDNITVVTVTNC